VLKLSDVLLVESKREYVTSTTISFGEITNYPPGDHVPLSALFEGLRADERFPPVCILLVLLATSDSRSANIGKFPSPLFQTKADR